MDDPLKLENYQGNEFLPSERIKEGFKYYFYLAYFPTKFDVSEYYQMNRKAIWAFKDGETGMKVASGMKSDIQHLHLSHPLSNWWLCVIPASTREKTERRFKSFCEEFCKGTEINNGYDIISASSDRDARHLIEDRNAVDATQNISIGNVQGKRIILFDDLITTGKSFLRIARLLKRKGAVEVVGLFQGKTHWLENI